VGIAPPPEPVPARPLCPAAAEQEQVIIIKTRAVLNIINIPPAEQIPLDKVSILTEQVALRQVILAISFSQFSVGLAVLAEEEELPAEEAPHKILTVFIHNRNRKKLIYL